MVTEVMETMSEQNKDKELSSRANAPKSAEGAVKVSGWKKFLAKKWVFPAVYMAAAVIILTLMWVYTDSGTKPTSEVGSGHELPNPAQTETTDNTDALPVAAAPETMSWPVADRNEVEISLEYFDSQASNDVRQAAMIEYGNTLTPHVGIDFAKNDNTPFEVVAALSGKVTRVEKDPVVGHLVEIEHNDGLVTVYQSLAEVKVAKDAEVKKGDVIALSGRNELEKDEGTHLHFEVRQNGVPINPETLIVEN